MDIVAAEPAAIQPATDLRFGEPATDPVNSGAPLAEVLRLFVLFAAATILVGGVGFAVVRRGRT